MITVDDIHALKTKYTDELYSKTTAEQKTDDSYINDNFAVPEVPDPYKVLRSGIGRKVVDAPAEQIITSNPQAYIDVLKGTADAGKRVGKLVNREWIPLLKQQNPNAFNEFVKNLLGRGEAYIKVCHNENWVTGARQKYGLPFHFLLLDSMVVFGSPEEDHLGRPARVIVFYERQPADVLAIYPHWQNPKDKGTEQNKEGKVEWLEYWDKDVRYFEADGEPVLKGETGIQPHLYGFTPFVRKYSGFGRRSPDGELSSLIVSDIRFSRDLIKEECAIRSDIASIMHLFAHKKLDLFLPAGMEVNEAQIRQEYNMGAGSFNILPAGIPPDNLKEGVTMLPTKEAFQHLAEIEAKINQRFPFIMAGFPMGTSGRQQDMSMLSAMRRYDTVVENTEYAFGTALRMALEICNRVPTLKKLKGIEKGDLDIDFNCTIKLKEKDPIEADRLSTLGSRLWNAGTGEIDLRTDLIQYKGYTADEAEEIIANILVDKLTLYNPDVAEVMGMVFAEESGMERWIEMAKERRMAMEQGQGMQKPASKTTQQRMQGEAQTELGREIGTEAGRGARTPPGQYSRGA